MYDPVPGRWLEEDPEGFEAGDVNLYRYIKNSPVNATDPSGLFGGYGNPFPPSPGTNFRNPISGFSFGDSLPNPPFPPTGTPMSPNINNVSVNTQLPVRSIFNFITFGAYAPTDRSTYQSRFPFNPNNAPITLQPGPRGLGTNVVGGSHRLFPNVRQPGTFAGTAGCGPSVGVIINSPGSGVAVFHFGTQNGNAADTIGRYTWPPGSRAMVIGGNGEPVSNILLGEVIEALQRSGISIDGVAAATDGWIGADGRWYTAGPQDPQGQER